MRESLLSPKVSETTAPVLLGSFGTLLQIFRLYCGTGLLAFPYAVKCGGILLAPLALIFIGALNNYSLRMLVHCKRRITEDLPPSQLPTTLDDLAFAAFGYGGRMFTSLAMVLSLLGLCSGYLIFVGKTLRSAFGNPTWSHAVILGDIDMNLFTVIATVAVLPLTMIRNYNRVQWSGVLGNLSLGAAIVVVIYHVILNIVVDPSTPSASTPSSSPPAPAPAPAPAAAAAAAAAAAVPFRHHDVQIKLTNFDELPVFLGLVFFAFAVQGVILGVEASSAKPKKFLQLLDWGAVIGVGLYVGFGCLSYYSYGSMTTQIIFQSIASEDNSLDLRIVEVLFCLSMILLYPMQLVPVVQIFERWFKIQDTDRTSVADDGRVGTAFSPWLGSEVDPTTGDRRLSSMASSSSAASGNYSVFDAANEQQENTMCQGPTCFHQNVLRIFLTLCTGAFAVLFGDVFSQILSIVGALGFSLLSFILPPLIYMKIFGKDLTCFDTMMSLFIFILGMIGMSIATVIDAESIISYFQGNTTDPCL